MLLISAFSTKNNAIIEYYTNRVIFGNSAIEFKVIDFEGVGGYYASIPFKYVKSIVDADNA